MCCLFASMAKRFLLEVLGNMEAWSDQSWSTTDVHYCESKVFIEITSMHIFSTVPFYQCCKLISHYIVLFLLIHSKKSLLNCWKYVAKCVLPLFVSLVLHLCECVFVHMKKLVWCRQAWGSKISHLKPFKWDFWNYVRGQAITGVSHSHYNLSRAPHIKGAVVNKFRLL